MQAVQSWKDLETEVSSIVRMNDNPLVTVSLQLALVAATWVEAAELPIDFAPLRGNWHHSIGWVFGPRC